MINENWDSLNVHSSKQLVQVFFLYRFSSEVLFVMRLGVVLFGRLIVWFEQINAINRAAHNHLKVDRVEFDLLDFLLPLMQEHQFVWHIRVLLFVFYWHIPNRQSIIFTCHSNHWLFVGLESDRCDRFSMPVEAQQLLTVVIFAHSQIPNFDQSIITTRNYQMLGDWVPISDIDILIVCLDLQLRLFSIVDSHVNNLKCAIGRD